jgi:hypothetical protein
MDQEQKTLVALSQDPEVAARIVRNIANVERGWQLANGYLSERMMRDVRELFARLAPESWKVVEAGWSALLVPPNWKMTNGVGNGDAWLELVEICEADEEYPWIAAAVGAGSTQMGFQLQFRPGLMP